MRSSLKVIDHTRSPALANDDGGSRERDVQHEAILVESPHLRGAYELSVPVPVPVPACHLPRPAAAVVNGVRGAAPLIVR